MLCYCGSGKTFIQCCQPYLAGEAIPATCLLLMRSRYSAYCAKNVDYIYATYHPDSRVENTMDLIASFANGVHFLDLQILPAAIQQDTEVSFSVRYLQQNFVHKLQETSRFELLDKWYYVDGKLIEYPPVKIGRNDLCPCRSGLKFKQCFKHMPSGV